MNSSDITSRNRRKPPTRYFSQKFQRKLLGMVFLLVLILLLMKMVAKPENWNWFFILSQPRQTQQKTEQPEKAGKSALATLSKKQLPLVAKKPGQLPFQNVIDSESLTIPPQVFEEVVDWTIKNRILNVTVHEAPAYYSLLKKIRNHSSSQLQNKVQPPISYSVLNEFASENRGKLFRLQGAIRICRELPSGNERQHRYGLEKLYEVWLTTPDSGNRLYRVVLSELPNVLLNGLQTSDEPFDTLNPVNVNVTGYFFKIQGYSAQAEQNGVPLLLAHSLEVLSAVSNNDKETGLVPYIAVFVFIIAGTIGFMVWRHRKSDREFETKYKNRMREASPEAIEQIKNIPTTNVEESLRKLADDTTELERE